MNITKMFLFDKGFFYKIRGFFLSTNVFIVSRINCINANDIFSPWNCLL